MTYSRWTTACLLACLATQPLASDSYPPPTGPYSTHSSIAQPSAEWAPDPTKPSPFNNIQTPDYGSGTVQNQPDYNPGYYSGESVANHPSTNAYQQPDTGYQEPYQQQRGYSFNPFGMANSMSQPMENMFGNQQGISPYDQPASGQHWSTPPGYDTPYTNGYYGSYPQPEPYGYDYYPDTRGYGSAYGYPGYDTGYGYDSPYYQQPEYYGYSTQPQAYGAPYGDYYPSYQGQQSMDPSWQPPSQSEYGYPSQTYGMSAPNRPMGYPQQSNELPTNQPMQPAANAQTYLPAGSNYADTSANSAYEVPVPNTAQRQPANPVGESSGGKITAEPMINGQPPVFRPLQNRPSHGSEEVARGNTGQ